MEGEVGYIQVFYDLRHNHFYLKAIKFNWKKDVVVIIYNLTRDYYSFIKRLKTIQETFFIVLQREVYTRMSRAVFSFKTSIFYVVSLAFPRHSLIWTTMLRKHCSKFSIGLAYCTILRFV